MGQPRSKVAGHYIRRNKVIERDGDRCSLCGLLPVWNNKPLTLQVDHINGVNNDHRIENLRLLCPNCHTQTDTFGARNIRKYNPSEDYRAHS